MPLMFEFTVQGASEYTSESEADWPKHSVHIVTPSVLCKGQSSASTNFQEVCGFSGAIARAFFFALHGQRCRDDTEHFAKHRSDSKQKCEFSLWAAPRWHLLRELLMDEDLNNTALGGFTVGKFQAQRRSPQIQRFKGQGPVNLCMGRGQCTSSTDQARIKPQHVPEKGQNINTELTEMAMEREGERERSIKSLKYLRTSLFILFVNGL
eukprot:Skav213904  [mRNA]  locus=scaffold1439:118703:121610:- [translate_table: standard]